MSIIYIEYKYIGVSENGGTPIFGFSMKTIQRAWGSICGTPHMLHIWLVVDPTPLKNDGVRQMGLLFILYGNIENVPNHPPDINCCILAPMFSLSANLFTRSGQTDQFCQLISPTINISPSEIAISAR